MTIQGGMPTVYGDRRRLIEVVQNIVDNAAKFTGSQPEPLIEIGQEGLLDGKPIFFIKDNGIGIEPEHLDRIFGLFNKLDASSDGTGIGLTIVKRIIEVHNGRIWVESEAGKGSTFFFTLQTGPAS
jgi:signal transduction histidine kinase